MGNRVLDSPPCYRPVCSSHSQLCLEVPHKTVHHAAEKQRQNIKSRFRQEAMPWDADVFLLRSHRKHAEIRRKHITLHLRPNGIKTLLNRFIMVKMIKSLILI